MQLDTLQRMVAASISESENERPDWIRIGYALNVVPNICLSKHALLLSATLKHGPYTAEEDALIRQRVDEWGDPKVKRGLWPRLQKEMRRNATYLRQRWFSTLFHRAK